ncbi:heparinase II/III family protein [Spirosoma sp. KNUC1025]|uniref:heparinase II/III family protein n=1 Tax=Spirosoma sp. KNUC1025 TaxID=2894082 RepID=UPI003869A4B4|nr:heparinase II/III family protein [Spirosoma sp. KNUC1025]
MIDIGLIWRTVRHLTVRQIFYQLWNRVRSRPRLYLPTHTPLACFLTVPTPDKPVCWNDGGFTFLNKSVVFDQQIDWNYAAHGKLWTYNLTYFDFLNQPNVTPDAGISLIRDFIIQTDTLRDGLEPYPTSLRIINWVQFLSYHQINDAYINTHLFAQVRLLRRRLEYHLGGNHLLENGFALLIGALYFQHRHWFRTTSKLIRSEITTQILADGGHIERSPMYHQILLDRLLFVMLALQHDSWQDDPNLVSFLTQKVSQMLGWLNAITFRNGDVPMVNDAALGIALTTKQLLTKADQVISRASLKTILKTSGYRIFRQSRYELFCDVGSIGPDHQPGHAHADTFSFVLHVDNQPFIIDSGTSTYQIGQQRDYERSTAAHNTVEIAGANSSEVWAGFRVGHRAWVTVSEDTDTFLAASHDGYKKAGVIHRRSWTVESTQLIIVDQLIPTDHHHTVAKRVGIARFHFHPDIPIYIQDSQVVAGNTRFSFTSVTDCNFYVTQYTMAEGFNRLRSGQCLEIAFTDTLTTTLTLLHENSLPNLLF